MRTELKHTPGPWKVEIALDGSGDKIIIAPENDKYVGEIAGERDAYLVAKAPNMLVALEEIELRCTQARLASQIGRQSGTRRAEFLLRELERLQVVARTAITEAEREVIGG